MPPRVENQRSSESAAVEDYLEQISHLIEEKGYARVVDIADKLSVSQASVTNMIRRMDANGLVVYEKYRGTVLTEAVVTGAGAAVLSSAVEYLYRRVSPGRASE